MLVLSPETGGLYWGSAPGGTQQALERVGGGWGGGGGSRNTFSGMGVHLGNVSIRPLLYAEQNRKTRNRNKKEITSSGI